MTPGTPERAKQLFEEAKQLRDDEVIADGIAVAAHLKSLSEVAPTNAGVVGFCLGERGTSRAWM